MSSKKVSISVLCVALAAVLVVFTRSAPAADSKPPMLVAAAASLRLAFDNDLIPMYLARNPGLKIEATYDSSGKLQAQIENGMEADVFMSAAPKQMNALLEKGFVAPDSIVNLLENKIVLICPASMTTAPVTGFADADTASSIAVGDPDSVPAGQYAREVFTSLGNWDKIMAKASLGTNVTEVLSWVSMASADVGVVYATDAASTDKVRVIAEAPEGSLTNKVIYPVGRLKRGRRSGAAMEFVRFLNSPEALAVFEKHGFTAAK